MTRRATHLRIPRRGRAASEVDQFQLNLPGALEHDAATRQKARYNTPLSKTDLDFAPKRQPYIIGDSRMYVRDVAEDWLQF
jgi:hypothetical protein